MAAKRLTEPFLLRRSAIYSNPENPADTLQIVYGDLTNGDQGIVPCVCIKKWDGTNMVYLIADHPIVDERPTIYVNDVEDTASTWSFSSATNYSGLGTVAILTTTVDMSGKQISVRCKGKVNADDLLITNPCEQIYDLIYIKQGITNDFDLAAYAEAADLAAEIGIVTAGVIMEDGDHVTICDNMLEPFGGATAGSDGKLKLFIEGLPTNPVVQDHFDEIFIDGFQYELSLDQIINDVRMKYAFNWRKSRFQSNFTPWDGLAFGEDITSQLEFKQRTTPNILEGAWLRTSDVAKVVVDTILALWRAPRPQVTLSFPNFRPVYTNVADIVTFSHRKYPGGSHTGGPGDHRLIRVCQAVMDPTTNTCKIVGSDLGRRLPRSGFSEEITLGEELIVERLGPDPDMRAAWVFNTSPGGRTPNLFNPSVSAEDAVLSGTANTDNGYLLCPVNYSSGAAVPALTPNLKPATFTQMLKMKYIGPAGYAGGTLGINNNRNLWTQFNAFLSVASSMAGPTLGSFPGPSVPGQNDVTFSIGTASTEVDDIFTDYEDRDFFFILTFGSGTAKFYMADSLTLTSTLILSTAASYAPMDSFYWGYNPSVPYWYSNIGIYFAYLWSAVKSQAEIDDIIADPTLVLP